MYGQTHCRHCVADILSCRSRPCMSHSAFRPAAWYATLIYLSLHRVPKDAGSMNKISPSIPILSIPISLEEGAASNDIIFPSLPWSSLSVGTRDHFHKNAFGKTRAGGGGTQLFFFSGRGVRPGFPKCGACELILASEKGGLWTENFKIWGLWTETFQIRGLVSWQFPNSGACELKFGRKLRL